ncbi:hypothetical protein FZ046_24005 [Mycolicibacterium grossiae]|nr:hypothetical protein FZ046_24005 [Mycolicibacterium grossiae]
MFWNKRPACAWLRSSSYNAAGHGSTVTKSLCPIIAAQNDDVSGSTGEHFGSTCPVARRRCAE